MSKFTTIFPGEPNGGNLENCAVVWPDRNAWNDAPCSHLLNGFCHMQPRPRFVLRGRKILQNWKRYFNYKGISTGLPDKVFFDQRYTMATHEFLNGHYSFDGYTNTKIFFENVTKLWRLELFEDSNIYATTESYDYPFGIQQWKIVSPNVRATIPLSLNGCNEQREFNCDDGVCIAIGDRYHHIMGLFFLTYTYI